MNGSGGVREVSVWISDDGFPMRVDYGSGQDMTSLASSNLDETSFEVPSEGDILDL
ncbi:hypothetical protein [Nocardiopsis sp. CNT312]|uniref:hypothetical protein n=1 Tax=Nocardiopsis sp. CNT312 TaxID=1137268 RepID=UPI0004B5FC26|nr:hypothetical protein [Nocardiopsis sp. CNT312]